MSQRQNARWEKWLHLSATSSNLIATPGASDYVYLCFGLVNVIGATNTGRINFFSGSITTTLLSIDASALGNTSINFGELGAKMGSAGAALYAHIAVTCDSFLLLTGYVGY